MTKVLLLLADMAGRRATCVFLTPSRGFPLCVARAAVAGPVTLDGGAQPQGVLLGVYPDARRGSRRAISGNTYTPRDAKRAAGKRVESLSTHAFRLSLSRHRLEGCFCWYTWESTFVVSLLRVVTVCVRMFFCVLWRGSFEVEGTGSIFRTARPGDLLADAVMEVVRSGMHTLKW